MHPNLEETKYKGYMVLIACEGPDHYKIFIIVDHEGFFIVGPTKKAVTQAVVDGLDADGEAE